MLKTAKCKGVTPHPSLLFTSLPHASRHSTNVPRFLSTATCITVERPSSLKPCHVLPFDLPPFSLIGDFRKQNTRENVSKNFRQSCMLSTDRIEIHQSQPLVWPSDLDNTHDWRKFWKRFRGCFLFESRVSRKTVVRKSMAFFKSMPSTPDTNSLMISAILCVFCFIAVLKLLALKWSGVIITGSVSLCCTSCSAKSLSHWF